MALIDRNWSPSDTLAIKRVTCLDVSPDGRRLAFTVNQAVMIPEKNGFLAQIYLTEPGGTPPRQLTTGETSSFAADEYDSIGEKEGPRTNGHGHPFPASARNGQTALPHQGNRARWGTPYGWCIPSIPGEKARLTKRPLRASG